MANLESIKSHFDALVRKQGCIYESDYHAACHGITDEEIIDAISEFLLSSGYSLKKGIGDQYKKEVMQKVKNPNIEDVKDTKNRTHKNKDKFQKSKKNAAEEFEETERFDALYEAVSDWITEHVEDYVPPRNPFTHPNTPPDTFEDFVTTFVHDIDSVFNEDLVDEDWVYELAYDALSKETQLRRENEEEAVGVRYIREDASFHLNKVIDSLKDSDDEFLPTWKRKEARSEQAKSFFEFLASIGIDADAWEMRYDPHTVRQLIMSTVSKLPEGSTVAGIPELEGVDVGDIRAVEQVIDMIEDTSRLDAIFRSLNQLESVPTQQQQPVDWQQPSSTDPSQFFDLPEGPPIETASKQATIFVTTPTHKAAQVTFVAFKDGPKFKVSVAETVEQKAAGLEVVDSLDPTTGMLFPFEGANNTTFHMGAVKFPIDIVFLMESPHGMEVGKVVHNAQPGTKEHWSFMDTKAVLEVVGGTCIKNKISTGSVCTITQRVEASSDKRMSVEAVFSGKE